MKLLLFILIACFENIHGERLLFKDHARVRSGLSPNFPDLPASRPGLVGGYRELNLLTLSNEEKASVEDTAKRAVDLMNDVKTEHGSNNNLPLILVSIKAVAEQVVAGLKYRINLVINIDRKVKICKLIVTHLEPWKNGGRWSVCAIDDKDPCASFASPFIEKRSVPLLGGENAVDTNDAMVQKAAQWTMEHVNKMSNSLFMQSVLKVTEATKQVINGLRYHLNLTTVFTSCRNKPENHHKTLEECPAAVDPKPQECDISVIFSQGEYTMEKFQCTPLKRRIGGDDHDYIPHGRGALNVKHMSVLDSDTPKYNPPTVDMCSQYLEAFKEFKIKHSRVYESAEMEDHRFKIFCSNMKKVKIIQSVEQGSAQYGATQFADLSVEEFKKQYLGFKPPMTQKRQWPQAKIPEGPIPESWDWRDHNVVTPVKNQGGCGSCWAFSTTGNIEGQWAIHSTSHNLVSLSEQELVDCDKLDQGCNGGFMYDAYEAIKEIGGIETEKDYKYIGQDQKCQFNKSEVAVKVTGAVNISKDEGEMAAWLYKNGPIAIGINSFPMQFYLWGIAHPWKFFCDPNALDHGVLIVGYGKKGNEPYWIIKNSWGPRWGREGYYYIYRGDGSCGLNTMCSSATVA